MSKNSKNKRKRREEHLPDERHVAITFPDGKKYVGRYKNGKKHGQGTLTWPSKKYVGEWKDNKRHGQGTLTWPDGTKYVGEHEDGKMHGQGTLTFPDGEKYDDDSFERFENGWKDSKRLGQGTLTFPDGSKYVGQFKDGKLTSASNSSTGGSSSSSASQNLPTLLQACAKIKKEKRELEENLKKILECPVCWEIYNDNNNQPLTLSCTHTICKSCWEIISNNKCPMCRQPVTGTTDARLGDIAENINK